MPTGSTVPCLEEVDLGTLDETMSEQRKFQKTLGIPELLQEWLLQRAWVLTLQGRNDQAVKSKLSLLL